MILQQNMFKKEKAFECKSIKEYWQDNPKSIDDSLEFMQWFDMHESKNAVWVSGYLDLHQRILNKTVLREIKSTHDKSCLEIGYGGGRILNAAYCMFEKCYGVDVHECKKRVANITPNKIDESNLLLPEELHNIKDESLDLIYSYIVFQHFDSIETFNFYADIINKKLKKGGVFNIFYGLNAYNSEDYFLLPKEKLQARGSSLFINPHYIEKTFNRFKVLDHNFASKLPWLLPEELPSNSQAYIIGKKT